MKPQEIIEWWEENDPSGGDSSIYVGGSEFPWRRTGMGQFEVWHNNQWISLHDDDDIKHVLLCERIPVSDLFFRKDAIHREEALKQFMNKHENTTSGKGPTKPPQRLKYPGYMDTVRGNYNLRRDYLSSDDELDELLDQIRKGTEKISELSFEWHPLDRVFRLETKVSLTDITDSVKLSDSQ